MASPFPPQRALTVVPGTSEVAAATPGPSASLLRDTDHPRWRLAGLFAAAAALLAPYLIALGSPLRLLPDSVTYLAQADHIRLSPSVKRYPPGYPALLRVVEHLGLGAAWGFVAVNLILLAVAVGVAYYLCRHQLALSTTRAVVVCAAVLLVHIVSEVTPIVLSDIAFFAIAMVCLLALSSAERRVGKGRIALVVLAGVLASVGVSVRLAGLTLVPPTLFVAVGMPNLVRLWWLARRHVVAAAVASIASLCVLAAASVAFVRATSYAHVVSTAWRTPDGVGVLLANKALHRLQSVGDLAAQTSNCCRQLPEGSSPLIAIAGAGVLALIVLGWLARRRVGAIEVFVLSTAAIVLLYGGAPRFWIPALPFMIVYCTLGVERFVGLRAVKLSVALYLAFFVLAGGWWMVQSVRLSTSGRQFPRLWSSKVVMRLGATYRVAFHEIPAGESPRISRPALVVLRRYEPLARNPNR